VRREFVIANEQGLHARPATTLVQKANEFRCNLRLIHEGRSVDLKSIMGVLSLGVQPGSLVVVEAEGDDAAEALNAIGEHIAKMKVR